jgi:hypothetical protein
MTMHNSVAQVVVLPRQQRVTCKSALVAKQHLAWAVWMGVAMVRGK